jgi:hypothetical protein
VRVVLDDENASAVDGHSLIVAAPVDGAETMDIGVTKSTERPSTRDQALARAAPHALHTRSTDPPHLQGHMRC